MQNFKKKSFKERKKLKYCNGKKYAESINVLRCSWYHEKTDLPNDFGWKIEVGGDRMISGRKMEGDWELGFCQDCRGLGRGRAGAWDPRKEIIELVILAIIVYLYNNQLCKL